ncbi:Flp pilus assembly protein TadB [Kitasatospora sp. GP30]|uniref:hypothetical protein n=1 Tax=Kitasatospora sp. GP30 TaxID=3035084 RepID=UPI002473D33E|nr:hypothetical protein [Kitasatospora sp. GP30]MDH6141170.1 Flp pilus assembly protein TadB [Kitasatospora sp. GP30]
MDQLVVWCVAVTAVAGVIALVWRLTRRMRQLMVRLGEFVDDWTGIPSRPGVPGHEGVMARLGGIEDRLTAVEHELHPNSGGSLRDALDRVEQCVTAGSPPPASE